MAEVDVDAIAGRGAALKARLDALQTIEDRSSLESACLVGLDAKALAAEVSGSVLDELKGLAYALHKELSGLCSELTTPAKDAETAIKIGIEQFCSAEMREHYLRELEAQGVTYQRAVADRERELKALRAAGRGADADAIERMPIHNPYIPKPYAAAPVPGVSISVTGHQCVVVDASLLPADLLKSVPDQDLIGARAAATGFAKPIPGVEFVPLYRIAFTRRK